MTRKCVCVLLATLVLFTATAVGTQAQVTDEWIVLADAQLTRVVPPGFYFEGQSAPTQVRNAAAARLGAKRHVIAGMVDTSGYSADVREKYQGFFITDSPIVMVTGTLPVGAYGFGFTSDGRFNILDVGGKVVMSVSASQDETLARPRPLMLVKSPDGVRLYSGRSFVSIMAAREEVEL